MSQVPSSMPTNKTSQDTVAFLLLCNFCSIEYCGIVLVSTVDTFGPELSSMSMSTIYRDSKSIDETAHHVCIQALPE